MSSSSLPQTYKVAQFESKGADLILKEVPLEQPKSGEVLVKVLACGVCHSDLNVQQGTYFNPFPMIPGHECIGDIVAIGEGEKTWKIGDRVGAAWHGGHCGQCKNCKRGDFQFCKTNAINGVTRHGGYGQYVVLRAEAVVPIPTTADPASYCPLLCAGVAVFNSLRKQDIRAGELVAVQGLGGLGHLALQYYSKMGYKTVAISSSAAKESFARELGAHVYIDSSKEDVAKTLQGMGGAACVVLTAPNPQLVQPLMMGLAARGTLLLLAGCGPVTVVSPLMVKNGWRLQGWPSGHVVDAEEAVGFAQTHGVKCLVERFTLEDAPKALEHMANGKARFRAVLVMG